MSVKLDARQAARLRRRLLAWFDRHRRDLPWRRTRDPYAIWLSEMMLQQTQVATVIPYYDRFLARFPSVADLAAASLDEVLELWAGLGYYTRARNLHRAAKVVVSRDGGRFPDTVAGLRSLPGIGPYSAAAVASIAFGARAAAIDGNVQRVLARLFGISTDIRGTPGRTAIERLAEGLMPKKRCGDFNQAMMELGATVCVPGKAARCLICPLRSECKAHETGTVADLPRKAPGPAVKLETHVVAAITRNGRWLVVRRPTDGLWGGLWELPTAVLNGTSTTSVAARIARQTTGPGYRADRRPFCDFQHKLTHRTIRFLGHVCRGTGGRETAGRGRWRALEDLEALGMSAAMRKVIAALREEAV